MTDKTICPFCKQKIETRYFWKGDEWTCGCFNESCKIKPKTRCVYSEEEAIKEWETAYVN